MSANTLGTLTLDLVAKIGGFIEPLSRAERAAQKSMEGIGASVNSVGEYSDKATKELAKLAQQMDSQFHDIGANMKREIALYGEVTRAAKLRYDLEKGNLRSMSAEQKASLMEMARRLDMMDSANEAFMANTRAVDANGKAYRGARGMAQQFGWQMQDVVVQMQMGTDAAIVFSQQGSQLASAFSPMLGLVIAISGVVAGAFLSSLFGAGKAAEDMAENIKSLITELDSLNEKQKEIVGRGVALTIEDQMKKYDDLTKSIIENRKEIEYLNRTQGQTVTIRGSTTAYAPMQTATVTIDNTDKLSRAKRELVLAETEQLKIEKEILALRDPTGFSAEIKSLNQKYELIGKTGEEYWSLVAAQKGFIDGNAKEFVAISMLIEQKEKEIELADKEKKKKDELAEKRKKETESLIADTQKRIAQMERENDLFGETSKAAQMKYDIEKGIIKVAGGIDGVNAKRIIELATIQDTNDANKKREETIKNIIDKLKEEEAQISQTAKEYLKLQLANAGADEATINDAMSRMDRIEEAKKAKKEMEDFAKRTEEMWNRVDEAAANAWEGMLSGASNALDGIKNIFRKTLAEMAHDAITKPILMQVKDSLTPWIDNLKKTLASSGGGKGGASGGGMTGLGSFGIWGLAAAGVAAAVSSFNKKQDEIARKMSSEYRQSTQSLGTILGESGKKSESIANSISILSDYADDTLSVNYQMYQALLDIREGIGGVAAGFARQFSLSGVGLSNSMEGTSIGFSRSSGLPSNQDIKSIGDRSISLDPAGLFGGSDNKITEFVQAFMGGITDKISKNIYSKKTKVIDSGIEIIGQSLASIMTDGTIEAFGYADIQTKKKFLGITTSNKVKSERDALDEILLNQFGAVFDSAGKALEMIAPVFGKQFSEMLPKLLIDAQKLSLKDLEGDALTKEIEAFFSSTLDNWAGVLVDGTDILEQFQRVGEGAFESVIRLASETLHFTEMTDTLGLAFNLVGVSAIEATQNISDAAGGFDALTKSLSSYYKEFYSEQEQADAQFKMLGARLNELGINIVPQTREAFRQLVEAQDLATEAGQKQFAALLGLSGAVDQYVDSLDKEAKARDELAEKARQQAEGARQKLKDAVGTAFDAFSSAIQRDMDVVNKALDSSRDLANSVAGALKSMNIESSRNDLMTRRAAQAQIASATAIARAGGSLPSSASLEGALSVLAQPSQDLFSSFEEYARDFYATKKNLQALEEQANNQVSIDEQNLAALQESLDYYQQQVDLLNGIDKGIISVEEAMTRLTNAFASAGVIVQTKAVPVMQTVAPVAIAADNIATSAATSQLPATQSLSEIVSMLKTYAEDMAASQYAIAKYSMDSKKVLEKWDAEGVPQERDYT